MSLEHTTELYASVLRQLLPDGVYETARLSNVSDDVYAHAKVLAQADIDAHRLLQVLEAIPLDLLADYEREYGLPMQCMVPSTTIEERLNVLKWVRTSRNVMNHEYLAQLLAIFGVTLIHIRKYAPMQCIGSCIDAVNSDRSRFRVSIIIQSTNEDIDCIIANYLPSYLSIDIVRTPMVFTTSRPYPIFSNEDTSTDFMLSNATTKVVMNEISLEKEHVVKTGMAISNATMRDIFENRAMFQEVCQTVLSLKEVKIREAILNTKITDPLIETKLSITAVSQRIALVSKNVETQQVITTCSLLSAQITN